MDTSDRTEGAFWERRSSPIAAILAGILIFGFWSLPGHAESSRPTPVVGRAKHFGVSPPLRSIPGEAAGPPVGGPEQALEVPIGRRPKPDRSKQPRLDPLLQHAAPAATAPTPTLAFPGLSNADNVSVFGFPSVPPDTNGDVGLTQYVQAVNTLFRVFDKRTGIPLTDPTKLSGIFAAAGATGECAISDEGDPIVLYDHLADRWLLSQFAFPPGVAGAQCIAISETGDATGSYFVYEFELPKEPDYSKFGVWPDAYYMTTNQFSGNTSLGVGAFAFNRAKMLAGDPAAGFIYFDLGAMDPLISSVLPADLDGSPPPAGTPNYLSYMTATELGDPQGDTVRLFEFHADFATPANSTFTERSESPISVAAFDPNLCFPSNNCVPQPGTTRRLDALSDRLLHRSQYRRFASCPFGGSGACGTLVFNHTVDVDGTDHAGVRWYLFEIDGNTNALSLSQQGTHAPDADHRWMGSAALDSEGNLAIGFSASGVSTFPSIRYSGRLATDPPGTLAQGEATLQVGSGSQTGTARWGDYSMLAVDPVDGCTFWYTNQYYSSTSSSGWKTRIGSFALSPSCPPPPRGTLTGVVTDSLTGLPIEGALVQTSTDFAQTTDAIGSYSMNLPPGTYTVTASAGGYSPVTVSSLNVSEDATTTQNFALPQPAPDLTGALTTLTQTCQTKATLKCSLRGSLAITNQGTAPTTQKSILVRVYLSADSTLDGGDALLKELSIRSPKVGQSQTKSVKVTLPAGTSASGQFVIAVVDPDDVIVETDEMNNIAVFGPIP